MPRARGAIGLAALATASLLCATARADEPQHSFMAFDLLAGEASGLPRGGAWETGDTTAFINARNNGQYLGGGWGSRLVYGSSWGPRISWEFGLSWGKLYGSDLSPQAPLDASRAWGSVSLGYQRRIGRFVLHSATVFGGEATGVGLPAVRFLAPPKGIAASVSPGEMVGFGRNDWVVGQQLGAHVQLAPLLLLFADVTVDVNGGWQVRAGIGLGSDLVEWPRHRHQVIVDDHAAAVPAPPPAPPPPPASALIDAHRAVEELFAPAPTTN
jgi:hypothetical protein